ncbi:MAG: hypothetical protein AAB354_08580 [candidate division KSB1 bacterium]
MNPSNTNPERSNLIWGGLALIVLGGIFLARNFELVYFGRNWWAFFLLIPLFATFGSLQRHRQASGGKFTPEVRNAFIGMLSLAFIMCVFLFEWSWHAVWPVFIIIAGLAVLLETRG